MGRHLHFKIDLAETAISLLNQKNPKERDTDSIQSFYYFGRKLWFEYTSLCH